MIDADTIKILERGAAFVSAIDPVVAEFLDLDGDNETCNRMRSWLQKRHIDTRCDVALNWKGRTYFVLERHPEVRRRRTRMRLLKDILRKRIEAKVIHLPKGAESRRAIKRVL